VKISPLSKEERHIKIIELMDGLTVERPLFHSEADFQHALAWRIHELYPRAKIRLEVPSLRFDKRERIDILVRTETSNYAIELKYKKQELKYLSSGEHFELRKDGAHDLGRYDFIKDVSRLERYIASVDYTIGYAALLTNDDLYWRESLRGINSAAFFLHEGRQFRRGITLTWHERTGAGTKKGRTDAFTLSGDYTIGWKDYSSIPEMRYAVFRYVALEVRKPD
jgi:hypothetical protein